MSSLYQTECITDTFFWKNDEICLDSTSLIGQFDETVAKLIDLNEHTRKSRSKTAECAKQFLGVSPAGVNPQILHTRLLHLPQCEKKKDQLRPMIKFIQVESVEQQLNETSSLEVKRPFQLRIIIFGDSTF